MRTRVALIDDHLLFREGLRAMLASIPDVQVVAEASNHDEAIPAVRNSRPEVVVLDMVLPGSSGSAIARELLKEDPRRRVLALSMMTDEGHVSDAFASGVLGYASKRQSAAEVLNAIRTVARGDRYLAPELSEVMADTGRPQPVPAPLLSLTAREREIFDYCILGTATKEIARQLRISPRTVETHRARILRKLGARSTLDLVLLAARWNMLKE
jgi:DNA-binding NarL/FixJ family response regulator